VKNLANNNQLHRIMPSGSSGSASVFLCCALSLLLLNGCGDRKSQEHSNASDQSSDRPTSPVVPPTTVEKIQPSNIDQSGVFMSEGGLREKSIASGEGNEIHPAALAARKRVGEELMAVLGDSSAAKKLISDRWHDAVKALPKTPLPSFNQSDAKAGKQLPGECLEILRNDQQFASDLMKGERPGVQTSQEIAAASMIQILAIGMTDNLPDVLGNGESEWPPTEADLIIFASALTGISQSPPAMNQNTKWQSLAVSSNPMRRMLALRSARQGNWGEQRDEGRMSFAKLYENESDPTVLAELAQMLGTIRDPSAQQYLETLRQNPIVIAHPEIGEVIENSFREWAILNSGTQ
jgi:hypothetical protein